MRIKHIFIIFLFLIGSHFFADAQAVRLRCTTVLPDGDVIITWNPLSLGTGFYNYTLFTSSDLSGPYSQLVIITDISQDSYLHTGAQATLAPVYYYLITNKDSGPSPPSDTLSTMLLSGSTIDFENIDLTWTNLHYQPDFLPDMHPWYLLYREYPPGNWYVVDSTQSENISHHFWNCNAGNDTVRFRIGVKNNETDCISLSNPLGEVLNNLSNRFPPAMDSVSIDADGNAVIGWQPAIEPDIVGYKIFKVTATNDSIDYVDGRFSTYYTDISADPCSGPMTYIILSVDSCGNESPFPFDPITFTDKPHTTIYLQDIMYDPCQMTNTLSWNEYVDFSPAIGYSNIFCSTNGGPYELLQTILPGQATYTHAGLLPNTLYSYYVRAYSQDNLKSSTSCIKQLTSYNSPKPLFMYLSYVTVVDNDHVEMMFYTDTSAHVQQYRILRSDSESGPYSEAGIVGESGDELLYFSDFDVDVSIGSYYYQVEVIDSCSVPSVIANTSRTIYLQAEALPDLSNLLSWNAYESWEGRTLGYKIYRILNDAPAEMLADVDSLTLSYVDDVSGLTGSVSRIRYYIEAYEGSSNPMGFREVSRSNEVLSEQEPEAYLPNGFLPLGVNTLFKPVLVFVGSNGYEFTIYNRWGQMLFRTEDPEDGWDGRYNGDLVPQDVYVYLLRFRNALDQPRQIKGNVAVIY